MDFEKRLFLVLGIVVGLIFLVSLSEGFTGYAVKDYSNYIEFDNVVPGNTIKEELVVEVEGEGIIKEVVEVEGEAKEWVTLESREYVFVPGVENKIPYKINVPEGVEGKYDLKFSVISVKDFEKDSLLSSQVISNIDVILNVKDVEESGFAIKNFEIYDLEEGEDLDFLLEVENTGNVEEEMEIKIVIEQDESFVMDRIFNGRLYAFEKQELKYNFPGDLEKGKYEASVYVKLGDSRKKTTTFFEVVDEQTLSKKARSLGTGVYVKDNKIYVTTLVENTGASVLDAHLRGTVGDNYFVSESERILPGDFEVFEYGYSEEVAGDYLLETEVYHDNVVLGHQETQFYVSDMGVVSLEMSFISILLFIILALVISHYLLTKKIKKNE